MKLELLFTSSQFLYSILSALYFQLSVYSSSIIDPLHSDQSQTSAPVPSKTGVQWICRLGQR